MSNKSKSCAFHTEMTFFLFTEFNSSVGNKNKQLKRQLMTNSTTIKKGRLNLLNSLHLVLLMAFEVNDVIYILFESNEVITNCCSIVTKDRQQ